jgi:hypothetical protein
MSDNNKPGYKLDLQEFPPEHVALMSLGGYMIQGRWLWLSNTLNSITVATLFYPRATGIRRAHYTLCMSRGLGVMLRKQMLGSRAGAASLETCCHAYVLLVNAPKNSSVFIIRYIGHFLLLPF